MYVRGNIRSRKCYSGNCPSEKCPFGELPVRRNVLQETVRRGNFCGELSVGEKSLEEMSVGKPPQNRHNSSVIKLITRLRLGFSHLREHKLRHNFQDTLNPVCSCGQNIETITEYLLHFHNYFNERMTLLNNLQNVGKTIFLIKFIPDFQRFSFSAILHLTMQNTEVF